MSGYGLYGAVVAAVAVGLAGYRLLASYAPDDMPEYEVLDGMTTRVCESMECMRSRPHVVLPCGAALCAVCCYENPASIGGAQ